MPDPNAAPQWGPTTSSGTPEAPQMIEAPASLGLPPVVQPEGVVDFSDGPIPVEKVAPLSSIPDEEFTGNRERAIGAPLSGIPGVVLASPKSDAMEMHFAEPEGVAGYAGEEAVEHSDVAVDSTPQSAESAYARLLDQNEPDRSQAEIIAEATAAPAYDPSKLPHAQTSQRPGYWAAPTTAGIERAAKLGYNNLAAQDKYNPYQAAKRDAK